MNSNGRVETEEELDPVVAELRDVKRLLVLLLMKAGAAQSEIAAALDITQPTVSKNYRFGDTAPILTRNER